MKRTARLPRRTPLPRGKALKRAQLLARRSVTPARPRRTTGFDPATRALILNRDQHACIIAVSCDGSPGTAQTVHHLENRGMGGAPSCNTVQNGVASCHLDNGWVEDNVDRARLLGWKRRRGDPPDRPVFYPAGWYRLDPDGTRHPVQHPATKETA